MAGVWAHVNGRLDMNIRYSLTHALTVALLLWLESKVSPTGTLGEAGAWLGQAWLSTCSVDHAEGLQFGMC